MLLLAANLYYEIDWMSTIGMRLTYHGFNTAEIRLLYKILTLHEQNLNIMLTSYGLILQVVLFTFAKKNKFIKLLFLCILVSWCLIFFVVIGIPQTCILCTGLRFTDFRRGELCKYGVSYYSNYIYY